MFYPRWLIIRFAKHLASRVKLAHTPLFVNPNSSHIRIFGCFLVYIGAVVLLACLLSPPLYWLGNAVAARGAFPLLEGIPFHRYFSRCIQIFALLFLWPAFRRIGLQRLSDLGLEHNSQWKRDVITGIGIAILPVLFLGMGYLYLEVYRFKKELIPLGIIKILGAASIVAILEEFLFRGVLFGLLQRIMNSALAAIWSSLIFAGVHFMRIAKPPQETAVEWFSGFAQLTKLFSSAPPWPLLGWGILSLFVAGLILALVTSRTHSLFLAIGLHAGWIFGQQGLQWLAKWRLQPPERLLPWVGPNVVSGAVPTGIIPVLTLLLTAGMAVLYLKRERDITKIR